MLRTIFKILVLKKEVLSSILNGNEKNNKTR